LFFFFVSRHLFLSAQARLGNMPGYYQPSLAGLVRLGLTRPPSIPEKAFAPAEAGLCSTWSLFGISLAAAGQIPHLRTMLR
jgi:hypothetical protein